MENLWFNLILSKRELETKCGLSKSMDSLGPIEKTSEGKNFNSSEYEKTSVSEDENTSEYEKTSVSEDENTSEYEKTSEGKSFNSSEYEKTSVSEDENTSEYEKPSVSEDQYTVDYENISLSEDENTSEGKNTSPFAPFRHLWIQCENCYGPNYKKYFKSKQNICEYCGYHLKMNSSDRIELSIDPGTWDPMDEDIISLDPIEFHTEEDPYKDRIDSYKKKTGLTEAIQTGTGQLNGTPIAIGVMEFEFMGGSMGSVVGERITRLIEYATKEFLPLILVCASGGARMQEGSLSLMQMAKISSALYDYRSNKKLFYVSILTSPTTGGVTASFGMLGDIIIAEPNAYIAFAGKRVIEETLKIEVPEGSQETEPLFDKGSFDPIVPRNTLKEVLSELYQLHGFFPWNQNSINSINN